MKAISGMDAAFLYAETPTSPMHVGSLAVIEGSLKFEVFREIIRSRIHLIPVMRQRLVSLPLSIDHPYWVDDPYFNLNLHIQHIALPRPGGWRELRALVSQIFSKPLDMSRPLWSFTFIEGLDTIPQVPAGSVALLAKMHHVTIDGVAGTDMLNQLFDVTPKPRNVPSPKPYKPKRLPNELQMALKSTMSFVSKPLKLPRLFSNTVSATVKAGFLTRVKGLALPDVPFTAPPTPLNGIISAQRKWNTAILSLDRIKALKNICGTTVNDVMLAICAGALRRYLLEKGKLPNKPLVAMVPVSTRTEGEKGGNQISNMLVQLATHIEDPIERLEAIYGNTKRGKIYQGALGAKTLAQMADAVPFGIANQAARVYSRFQLAKRHNPVFNVVISNVPGPQLPLYLGGHKLIAMMGMAPIIDGMGLIITILSYNGLVTISPTSDVKSMPDIDRFARYLRESANELEAAVLAMASAETAQKPKSDEAQESTEIDTFFRHMQSYLEEHPDITKEASGLFQLNITGPTAIAWHIDLNASPAQVVRGAANSPDATLIVRQEHFLRIVQGDLDIPTALIQGRLQAKGNVAQLMQLAEILTQLKQED
ncbi:MAG: wax ester/triacylglycerol synthase family O-acyltransferase [Ardenticatenaceae bacterium]